MNFTILKNFSHLELTPHSQGLSMSYSAVKKGSFVENHPSNCTIDIPIEVIGGLWATARAFLYGVESLDENIIIEGEESDTLVKLYRDRPKGEKGTLSGEENCWLRIVNGKSEEERRRVKLGPRDLLCFELACNSVLVMSGSPIYNAVLFNQ